MALIKLILNQHFIMVHKNHVNKCAAGRNKNTFIMLIKSLTM